MTKKKSKIKIELTCVYSVLCKQATILRFLLENFVEKWKKKCWILLDVKTDWFEFFFLIIKINISTNTDGSNDIRWIIVWKKYHELTHDKDLSDIEKLLFPEIQFYNRHNNRKNVWSGTLTVFYVVCVCVCARGHFGISGSVKWNCGWLEGR